MVVEMNNIFQTKDFLKEETRCDYKISVKQKKVWAVELELIQKLLDVCRKYDIKVYAFAGTLLGAVRHKGFIPWDDDMDVCLMREDYEKLISVAEKEFKAPFFFQTAFTDKRFHIGAARLRNSNTTGFIPNNDDINYNNGIFIDIFILNGYIENKIKLALQLFDLHFVERLIHAYYVNLKQKKGIKKAAMSVVKWLDNRLIKYDTLLHRYYKIQTRYDYKSDKVTILTSSNWIMKRYWCWKEDLKECILLPFESINIPVPVNFDRVLKNAYGDYMVFPPVEKRGIWHENVIHFEPDIPYVEYVRNLHGDK